ncbi:acetyl-CoA C-acetyltransferase [Salinisphaera sp.]|uniref:acetyl-CoA C-acetyltransferase n=1 Tax=Salinisphaera sp. TaxID=1914330 RepID=UPI002D78DB07|nr:acetyl-CoA C-acetyltransferase [Salinisphaera sp.]HET7315116.1 acetyl-CoA C-acetyltransferase [Salinisphaera sp.]
MAESTMRRVAIVGGARIPFCRANTAYAHQSNQDLLTATFKALSEKYGLAGERIGEVAAGAVLKRSRDFNLTREAVLGTDLDPHTPAFDVQQACGTSLETTILIANKIAMGQMESGIAGGTDTTSDAPVAVNEDLRRILLDINRARSGGERARLLAKLRPRHLVPNLPDVTEPRTGMSMGEHCELMAKEWKISRRAQDELALASHKNAAQAYADGFYDDLVFPYLGVERDNNLRPDTDMAQLSKLKPSFDKDNGTLTAGNSTPLTDGASSVLLASEAWAKARGLPILAYFTPYARTAAVDYVDGGEGLLMAPTYAVPDMLDAAGLTLADFDFYEIHEAFAAQVLCTLKAWESKKYCVERLGRTEPLGSIDMSKLNIKGSSVGLGHPFAATGGRIVATLAKILDEAGSGRGLISICAAGGQGVTAILEK